MSAKERLSKRHWPKGVVLIYEDRDILVVEKPPGLLTMGTDRVRSETLYLEIDLLTGRKHQIRVHLAEKGHSIVGNKKYGNAERTHKRLALHATSLSFNHPFSGKRVAFETKVPKYLTALMGPAAE